MIFVFKILSSAIYFCLVVIYFLLMLVFFADYKKFYFTFTENSSYYIIVHLQVILHCLFSSGGAIVYPMILIAKLTDISLFKILVLTAIFMINLIFSFSLISIFPAWMIYQISLLCFVILILGA